MLHLNTPWCCTRGAGVTCTDQCSASLWGPQPAHVGQSPARCRAGTSECSLTGREMSVETVSIAHGNCLVTSTVSWYWYLADAVSSWVECSGSDLDLREDIGLCHPPTQHISPVGWNTGVLKRRETGEKVCGRDKKLSVINSASRANEVHPQQIHHFCLYLTLQIVF